MLENFNCIVPKDRECNLEFRRRMWRLGFESDEHAAALRHMCRVDPLFFINTFCWTLQQTWSADAPIQPFIAFPVQQMFLRRLSECVGKSDIAAVKSRATGASYCACYVILHRWLFYRHQSFLMVSRKEKLVWNPGDSDALFTKIQFALDHLPSWLVPDYDLYEMRLLNKSNGSIVNGSSTTGEIGRGGRRTAIFLDEFAAFHPNDSYDALAATQAATNSRWFISTPQGVGNAFYDLCHNVGGSDIERIDISWSDLAPYAAGLYKADHEGRLEIIDKEYNHAADYKFILDGELRSPWYDRECARMPIKSLRAQELNRDFLGSGHPFFDPIELQRLKSECMNPMLSYTLDVNRMCFNRSGVSASADNVLRCWCPIDVHDRAPRDRSYVIGVDVSSGTGASNSAVSVKDTKTNEKVAEFVSSSIGPYKLAEVVVDIGKMFRDYADIEPYLIWDAGGPGREFGKRVDELNYKNVHYQSNDHAVGATKKRTPGFFTTRENKRQLLSSYGNALLTGKFLNRSTESLDECAEYQFMPNGDVAHVRSVSTRDPSGAKQNHGDRPFADALAQYAHDHVGMREPEYERQEVSSIYARMRERKLRKGDAEREMEGWLVG